jgi:cysteine-rich repeat protein
VCTAGDVCSGGSCLAGPALNCDDGNGCTSDSCSAATGCANVANSAACSDGSVCTIGDNCSNKVCVSGAAQACNDSNACTTDSCNATTGCINVNNTLACNDNNACTASDTCSGGACVGTTVNCNDSNICTNDACNSVSGCTHWFVQDGTGCGGNNYCSAGGCTVPKCGDKIIQNIIGENCDDGNTVSGDGCSATCITEGCADGTREDALNYKTFPNVAGCNGGFFGAINSNNADIICQSGWKVCKGGDAHDMPLMSQLTTTEGLATGCWVVNGSNTSSGCTPCTTSSTYAAAVGGSCAHQKGPSATSCTPNAATDDATSSALGCSVSSSPGWNVMTGVLCCRQ